MNRKSILVGLALGAIALTGCSNTATKDPVPDKATESMTPAATPTVSASPEVTDNTVGITGEQESMSFAEKADADLVANEMKTFADKALAHPALMSNEVAAPAIIKDLPVTGEARAYLSASLAHATEVTNDTFNNDLLRPRADKFGRYAALVAPETMKVPSEVITYQGEDALRAEFKATVDVFADQRAAVGAPWMPVTYRGTRHYIVTLVENPVEDDAAAVWLVANWRTGKANEIRFAQVEGE